ncbi:MAG TPA: SCO family protein [Candidatus Acidoferrales bacterium]|nr:SCO family protein [Candidatus Acidoferrales bacterium]
MESVSNLFESKVARSLRAALIAGAIALALLPLSTPAQLQGPVQDIGVRPSLLKEVGIDQKLNQSIPLNLVFRDEHGKTVQLGDYFGQKPVILSMVYYNCPMLCTQVLNGIESSLKLIPMDIGKQFNVVTVSIDPTERPVLADAKQALYTGLYGRPGAAEGWHFLTGDEPQIRQLANALGFRYAYDPDSKQFAHASAIMLLTPEGKISRYFYGIQFPSRDLRLGLVEASEGKIGTPVDQVLLFCYHYDPSTGKYGLLISRLIQTAGAVTVLAIATLILVLYKKEHYSLPERRT